MNCLEGSKVLITGSLGFIDSNLAQKLVDMGANALITDNLNADCVANVLRLFSKAINE